MKSIIILLLLLLGNTFIFAQSYEVELTPVNIDQLGGLQSYSIGTHDGEWLIVGGRLDGLHRRQPFAAFSVDGKNEELIVVNPTKGKVWRAALSTLPISIQEQLSSSNMQFYQNNNKLICTGGYGYSPTANDHITFPYLTLIDIPKTINDVKNNSVNSASFQQIENELFQATGGALNQIDDVYHLVGGHKFMGRYNPMGPNHGPGFEQEYTHEIRKFKIDTIGNISIEILESTHDEMHLRRRDYNLVPYLSNGERRLMAFSGVFQNTTDLPWLYPVSISKESHEPKEEFNQYFNHYHCAFLPIFDPVNNQMSTLFFGGIAQFYEENGIIVQDNDVPFVNTIAEVSIDKYGKLVESKLEAEMPGYLGAGSTFILDPNIQLLDDEIIDGSKIGNEFEFVGHIYGGIRSTMPNIFWINTGQESDASQTIYGVSIRKIEQVSSSSSIDHTEHLEFYPNPAHQIVRMSIEIDIPSELSIIISDIHGRSIHQKVIDKEQLHQGRNILVLDNVNIGYGAFLYTVSIGNKKVTRKVIWTE